MKHQFHGTFEIYQHLKYANIIAQHHQLNVVDHEGLLLLMSNSRYLGPIQGIVGCPELWGPFDQWWGKVRNIACACLTIRTVERIDPWDEYRVSADDNCNLFFDLSLGAEELYQRCTKKCRESIRIGRKKGVEVMPTTSVEDLKRIHQIALKISHNGRVFEVPSFHLLKSFLEASLGAMIIARHKGQVIGGYFLILTENVHVWAGGMDRDFMHLTPGNLMLYETIRWSADNGYRYCGLCDHSLTKIHQISRFKLSFNPLRTDVYSYYVPRSQWKIMVCRLKDWIQKKRKGEGTKKDELWV